MSIAHVITAFGLAGAAGLNAYIPLLVVAVAGRLGFISLTAPFDLLTSWPAIIALAALLMIEMIVDKVPGADHVNDVVQTFVRPAAGAVLFAANTGVIQGMDQTVGLIAGLVMALTVHGAKASARPVINVSTLGIGAPVISVVEDVTSAIASFLALFAPLVFILFVATVIFIVVRLLRRLRRRNEMTSVIS